MVHPRGRATTRFGANRAVWDDSVIMRIPIAVVIGAVIGAGPLPTASADVQMLSPFDVANPAVGNLDPALLLAVQQATTAAAADGVTMTITSGWRSLAFQQQLLDDAIATYGSVAAARQYVQTPERSRHVLGQAVDMGGVGADQWLIANGARFGLCQIYANELWHFELAADAAGTCPLLLPNAAT